jgi:diacylglycerol kinase family enzyme
VNPGAGAADRAGDVLAADPRFDLRPTSADGLPQALRDAVEHGARRLLVAGGDGTLASAAAVLAGTGVEMAVFPGGTLNHFARDHGIPVDPEAALSLAAEGAAGPVDAGYLNGRLFLNTSSLGVYVDLARYRDRFRPRIGYVLTLGLSMVLVFVRMRSFRVRVRVHGRLRSYRTPLVFLGVDERDLSLSGFGGRAPGGRRGLHLVVMRGKGRRRLLAIAAATALRGIREVARTPRADSELVDECIVELEDDVVEVALDGESHRLTPPLHYRLARDALTVVSPRGRT